MFSVVVALWLLLPSMAVVPGWPARAARQSTIAQWVYSRLPRSPDPLQALRSAAARALNQSSAMASAKFASRTLNWAPNNPPGRRTGVEGRAG